jgi:SNF2 family DNA or RNA helicase
MPGYLGTHRYFKQHYEIPIVRERETEGAGSENPAVAQRALIDLQRHIRPFILRRLKKDVLTELPDKVETKLLNEMTTKQAKIYKAYFLQSQKEFAQTLKEHGVDGGRMRILAILTRLRQIACDPALFLESWEGGSGKLDQLDELVTDAIEGGHRLLIFSQFTQLLARIRERFTHLGVSSSYLDGSTPAKERLSLVQAFNAGEHEVFLISLKAGGTGLNLTGADMVVHVDPWWNPAVEDQATDRAYRLGQQRKVQVVQLITKDTVEEKIYQLQAKKKALIDQMIQPGGGGISQLTEEELRSLFQ